MILLNVRRFWQTRRHCAICVLVCCCVLGVVSTGCKHTTSSPPAPNSNASTPSTPKPVAPQTQVSTPPTSEGSAKTTFRGRYRMADVPGKTGFESIEMVFQDLDSCVSYHVITGSGATVEFNTSGFYIIEGKDVGNGKEDKSDRKADPTAPIVRDTGRRRGLVAKSSKRADATASAELRVLAHKCPEP